MRTSEGRAGCLRLEPTTPSTAVNVAREARELPCARTPANLLPSWTAKNQSCLAPEASRSRLGKLGLCGRAPVRRAAEPKVAQSQVCLGEDNDGAEASNLAKILSPWSSSPDPQDSCLRTLGDQIAGAQGLPTSLHGAAPSSCCGSCWTMSLLHCC